RYFGTDAYAAPWTGTFGGLIVLAGGLLWLERRRVRAAAVGEGYGTGHLNEPEARPGGTGPHVAWALVPLALVLGGNFVLSRTSWSAAGWYPPDVLAREFPAASVAASAPTWALVVALLLGTAAALVVGAGRWRGRLSPALSAATTGALLAIFNTA